MGLSSRSNTKTSLSDWTDSIHSLSVSVDNEIDALLDRVPEPTLHDLDGGSLLHRIYYGSAEQYYGEIAQSYAAVNNLAGFVSILKRRHHRKPYRDVKGNVGRRRRNTRRLEDRADR